LYLDFIKFCLPAHGTEPRGGTIGAERWELFIRQIIQPKSTTAQGMRGGEVEEYEELASLHQWDSFRQAIDCSKPFGQKMK
jgi:hypothetical protein